MLAFKVKCPECQHIFLTFKYDHTECRECHAIFKPLKKMTKMEDDGVVVDVLGRQFEIEMRRRELIAHR